MMEDLKVMAVVPARGGSKGIPGKNLKLYAGKPLVQHSIDQALHSRYIQRVLVTTDNKEIAEIARKGGAEVPFLRPADISQDMSTDLEWMTHIMNFLQKEEHTLPDLVVQLRPTFPNRLVQDIDACIERFSKVGGRFSSLRSVRRCTDTSPYKMYTIEGDVLVPLFDRVGEVIEPFNACRQSLPTTFMHNGCIDIFKPETVLCERSACGKRILPYVMGENCSGDIDTEADWDNAENNFIVNQKTLRPKSLVAKKLKSFRDFGLLQEDRAFVIAEGGINHNGSVDTAKRLIDVAFETGADCIKFQKRTISRILTKEGLEKDYDNKNSFGKTYGEHKRHLELSYDQFRELNRYAREKGIYLTASGWDEESVDFLVDDLRVPFLKMASADLTNFPLLEHAARKRVPIILSTGMASMDTVRKAYDLVSCYNDQVALLQCTSTYPAAPSDIHLNVIQTYQHDFPNAVIGYSGHEAGLAVSLAAVTLGARVVERHVTLDRTMKGGDHAASLEPQELQQLITSIRTIEQAMGGFTKEKLPAETKCFEKLSKSIVSRQLISAGTVITRDMLTTKGPGTGISPMDMDRVVGAIAKVDIPEDVVLQRDNLSM